VPAVAALVAKGSALPVCPEQLGGLTTPRPRATLVGGDGRAVAQGRARVVDEAGHDVTAHFLTGAGQVLHVAKLAGATGALLAEGSPSCGVAQVPVDGGKVFGCGVTAAVLQANSVEVHPVADGSPHAPYDAG
jgi:uncharacterized protein YbbK (DUF523 family)